MVTPNKKQAHKPGVALGFRKSTASVTYMADGVEEEQKDGAARAGGGGSKMRVARAKRVAHRQPLLLNQRA